jgi:hypothetical protein
MMEDRYGRDKGNGWLLKHPIKKLLMFQQFALNNPDFLASKSKLRDYVEDDDYDSDADSSAGDAENVAAAANQTTTTTTTTTSSSSSASPREPGRASKKAPKPKPATPARSPAGKPAPPARSPAGKPATPARSPAGKRKAASPARAPASPAKAMPAAGDRLLVKWGRETLPALVVKANAREVPDSAGSESRAKVDGFVVSWKTVGDDSESFIQLKGGVKWMIDDSAGAEEKGEKEKEPDAAADLDPWAVVGEALAESPKKQKKERTPAKAKGKAARKSPAKGKGKAQAAEPAADFDPWAVVEAGLAGQ